MSRKWSTSTLTSQTDARREAAARNASGDRPDGMVNVATPIPMSSWSGHERGWTVCLVERPK